MRPNERTLVHATSVVCCFITLWSVSVSNGELIVPLGSNKTSSISDEEKYAFEYVAEDKLVTASTQQMIHLWNTFSGNMIRQLRGHTSLVYSLRFVAPNRLVSGSEDEIKLWSLDSGECLLTMPGHAGAVEFLELLPSSDRVASASPSDNVINVWSLSTAKCMRTILADSDGPTLTALRAVSSSKLASGSSDGAVHLWNLDNGERCTPNSKSTLSHSGPVYISNSFFAVSSSLKMLIK